MPTCPTCGQENPEIARFCLACGASLVEPSDQRAGAEERKVVSVLFCDLVGFTALSDRADPEDVRARLSPYHARLRQEIERFGGTMEKFIGDAVMAVFGAPVAHEDDAERAVRAGLTIIEAIEGLNQAYPSLRLAVRVGINTGEAVVSVAARREGESIVVGDVVNTASRLQSVAPTGGVVVGEATYRATRELFDYEELEPARLKGKSEPVLLWQAHAARRGIRTYPEPLGLLPFFNRVDELDMLVRTLARAVRERSVQVVTLVGEPGVGKTRLVREFTHWAKTTGDTVTWRYGRCLPYGDGITFWPLGEIVKSQAGILESDGPEEALAKLNAAVEALIEDPGEQEWVRVRLSTLAGITQPDTAGTEQSETYAAWRRFLEAIASDGPLALIFEDLHWADRAMLQFLHHLADWSTDVPMLVLCTARPELYERQPGWGGGMRNATNVSMAPLGDNEIKGLVSALLPGGQADAAFHDLVLERAGGNPLYAEEFARMLTDRRLELDQVAASDHAFPESIHAIIAARLDTLSPERKALLQNASVVGRVFWSGAVASMAGLDEPMVRDHLHDLARKELVRSARATSIKDQAEYTFWHALIRDVAYAQIPRVARARKHRQVAEWMVALAGEREAEYGELLAYHYGQALELEEAAGNEQQALELAELMARSLESAGDRALGLDARRAAEHYGQALDLLPADSPHRAPLLAKVAEAAVRAGRFEEAERTFRKAIDGLIELGEPRATGAAMVKLATVYWRRGDTARSHAVLDEAIGILEREEPGPELVSAYTELANDHIVRGRYDDALQWAKRALALMETVGVKDQAPSALSVRGMARWYMGDETGIDDLRAALDMASSVGLGRDAARLQAILGEFLWVTEGPGSGLRAFEEAVELAERRGNADLAMALRAERLGPLFDLGRWDELLAVADDLTAWSDAGGEGYFGVIASVNRGQVQLYRGAVEEAAASTRTSLPSARQIEDPQVLVQALVVSALIEHAAGKADEAMELIEEFERITRERPTWFRAKEVSELVRVCALAGSMPLAVKLLEGLPVHARRHKLSVLTAKAVIQEAGGEIEPALRTYSMAADGWGEFGYVLQLGLTALGAGRCLVRLGKPEAVDRLTEARAAFLGLGASPLVAETDAWTARAPARIP